MTLHANYRDDNGNEIDLSGETVREIAQQLPEDFRGTVRVVDEPGFTRGWVHARDDWRAA